MIDGDRGDGRGERPLDHVGGVEPAAQAGLQQREIGRRLGEGLEGKRGGDLEKRDGRFAVRRFAIVDELQEARVVDQAARHADALVEAHEVRRGIDVHPPARGFGDGAQEGQHRALAVGAGDMDHRRQTALGMIQLREQPLDAAERQIDDARMEPIEPLDDGRALGSLEHVRAFSG